MQVSKGTNAVTCIWSSSFIFFNSEKKYCEMGITSTKTIWIRQNANVLNQGITYFSYSCKFNFYFVPKVT